MLRNINNVLVYIDDLLIHTATHEEHLGESFRTTACQPFKNQFGQVCVWQSRGLLSGIYANTSRNQTWSQQIQAIKDAKPPTMLKMVRSFVGLCNFFRTHIKDFALIAAPLFQVRCQDSGYKSGPLPPAALQAFKIL
jgi:hypothetical protein